MQVWARQSGITFIESILVLAIVAILSGLAVPSFKWLREVAKHKRVTHQLHAAVLTARHTSVMEDVATYICPSPNAFPSDVKEAPECGNDYGLGVAVWEDASGVWRLIRLWQWPLTRITNRSGTQAVEAHVRFNAQGLASQNITWSTCIGEQNSSLVLNRVGRPHIRSQWGVC